jgi:hypothetical protein
MSRAMATNPDAIVQEGFEREGDSLNWHGPKSLNNSEAASRRKSSLSDGRNCGPCGNALRVEPS